MGKFLAHILFSVFLVSLARISIQGQSNHAGVGLALEVVIDGLDQPVFVSAPPGDSTRLFVVERTGRIRIVEGDSLLAVPFLDISDQVTTGFVEQGLLGLAFDPQFDRNGRFYINYSGAGGNTKISRLLVSKNRNRASGASEEVLLSIKQPYVNHNGGMLAFGPRDKYLYIGTGDGGAGGDPHNNAQNPGSLLGKMLRIDVSSGGAYSIPADNPFVDSSDYRPEIWSTGLRNPWRFSFDRATGDLWIADVGQYQIEEIDFQPADSRGGENYGWRLMEGRDCYNPSEDCNPEKFLALPIHQFEHSGGRCSITGGYVYRGKAIPALVGKYLFGDFCSGEIWALSVDSQNGIEVQDLSAQIRLEANDLASFGEDPDGELLLVGFSSGTVFRLVRSGR